MCSAARPMTAPAQPDLRKPARWFQNSASETRVRLSVCPSVRPPALSVPLSGESMLASKAFLPLRHPPILGHISHCHTSSTLSGLEHAPLLAPHATSCWVCAQNHRAGVHATMAEGMLLHLAKASLPPHWAGTGLVATPAP